MTPNTWKIGQRVERTPGGKNGTSAGSRVERFLAMGLLFVSALLVIGWSACSGPVREAGGRSGHRVQSSRQAGGQIGVRAGHQTGGQNGQMQGGAVAGQAGGRSGGSGRRIVLRNPVFSRDLKDQTLRVDVLHRGDVRHETYALTQMVLEGPWAGSTKVLLDPDDFGAYRFEVVERATGTVLYSRGYSSLFGEWQTTDEAKHKVVELPESLRFPLPRRPFLLRLYSRKRNGKMALVQQFDLSAADRRIRRFAPMAAVEVLALHRAGDPHHKLDVAIIGDGYRRQDRAKLVADARRFAAIFLSTTPFSEHRSDINLWLVIAPSKDAGVSEPRKGLLRKTAVGLSFNTFGSPRYMMTVDHDALRRVAAHAPYDELYLMANTSRYGGGGIYNLYSTFPSDNEYSAYVFMHEFGHTFGGLGDEYYSSPVATNDMYPPGVEPWEPNLTRYLGGRLKWRSMVTPHTPLPTPPDPKRYGGVVGLFEGAGYTGKGMYRPSLDCKMFSKAHRDYCLVCRRAVERRISRYAQ
ncbi:MAG: peptidase M64 [Deltaproteobacteria bacterium]|nr:peptidase M64 [Deltaproteobacteria bacterium]